MNITQGNTECLLRNLAENVASAIQSSADVLNSQVVTLPSLQDAQYVPTIPYGTDRPPVAHQFLKMFRPEGSVRKIVQQLQALDSALIWGHAPGYDPENVGQKFLDNYCHALITGPDGPLMCNYPLGAFVLFGPGTFYKEHSHAPNEVYLALSDGGQWKVGAHDWQPLNAGQTIFIPSNTVHAIQAGDKPLLTFSFWLEPGEIAEIDI